MCGAEVYGKKCSRWCGLGIISARPQRAMNQDVSETCIPPINAQRVGVKNFLCSWVIGQNTEVFEKNVLDFLVLWVVSEDLRYFLCALGPVSSSQIAECSFAANLLGSPLVIGNNTRISSVLKERCHFLGHSSSSESGSFEDGETDRIVWLSCSKEEKAKSR